MLDLDALITGMQALAGQVVASARRTLEARREAAAQLERAAGMESLRSALEQFLRSTDEELALPAAGRSMARVAAVPPLHDYTILATDGSQIAPDYHHIAPWYVLNAGAALFRYGPPPGRDRCLLLSRPILRPPLRALDAEEKGADARAAALALPPRLEVERLRAELELALELLQTEAEPDRSILLLDGPLVQWRMLQEVRHGGERERLLGLFRELLDAARERRIPVAGYISRSRAVQWVTLLRFSCCPELASRGALCKECRETLLKQYAEPPPGAHHARLAGLRDVELAGEILPGAGWRTEVVALRSRAWESIGAEGEPGFFYLHAGLEIGRVELPSWVWEEPALLDRLHAALWDQIEAGNGYPMVLAEAHEAAVVRAADRAAFYIAIERILEQEGLTAPDASAKAMAKRRPLA